MYMNTAVGIQENWIYRVLERHANLASTIAIAPLISKSVRELYSE